MKKHRKLSLAARYAAHRYFVVCATGAERKRILREIGPETIETFITIWQMGWRARDEEKP